MPIDTLQILHCSLSKTRQPVWLGLFPGPRISALNDVITIKTLSRESRIPVVMQGEIYRAEVWLETGEDS